MIVCIICAYVYDTELSRDGCRYKVRVEIARRQKDAEVSQQLSTLKQSTGVLSLSHLATPVQSAAPCAQCSVYRDEIQHLQSKLHASEPHSIPYSSSSERLGLGGMVMIQGRANKHPGAMNGSPRAKSTPRGHGLGGSTSTSNDGEDSPALSITPSSSGSTGKKKASHTHHGTANYGAFDAMEASKNQYARQMLLQYLSCKDQVVKGFIEDALCKLFRFSESELRHILDRRSFDNHILGAGMGGGSSNGNSSSSLASIGNYFGFK